jgi:hypothetical protein
MSRDKITLYNNRLGITTLAAPKDLPAPTRAALQATLRMEPGGSVTLDRDIVALMMRCPGNWPLVESGEISTRREETERRRPPTNLRKVPPSSLSAPKGVTDFVMGLRPDNELLRMIDTARQQRTTMRPRAAAARVDVSQILSGVPAGDYRGLLENLEAHGVSMDDLRTALGAPTPGTQAASAAPPAPGDRRPEPRVADTGSAASVDKDTSPERPSAIGPRVEATALDRATDIPVAGHTDQPTDSQPRGRNPRKG